MLWDKCFELAPQESKNFASGLWKNHIIDPQGGTITSQASFTYPSSKSDIASVRHVGFFIRTWAHAYHHTGDAFFLKAIDTVLSRCENKKNIQSILTESLNACESISLAIDCDGSARRVPEPLRSRLIQFAFSLDKAFFSLPHDFKDKNAFSMRTNLTSKKSDRVYTSMWEPKSNRYTTAAVAMMLPIGAGFALELGLDPLLTSMLIGLAGGLAFMLVIATPGNAITYSAGYFNTKDLFKAGLLANLVCILVLFLIAITYWRLIGIW